MFVDLALARRLEACDAACLVEHVAARTRRDAAFAGAMQEAAGGVALHSGPRSPINFAVGLGLDGPAACKDLDEIEAFYAERATPAAFKLSPFAHASLWAELRRRGYGAADFLNAWVRSPSDRLPPAPAARDVKIARVTAEMEHPWATTVTRGFAEREPDGEDLAFLYGFRDSPHTAAFLLCADGVPAAAGAVHVHDGVALLFNAATTPRFRGRRYQGALITHRLHHVWARGCDVALVMTSPGGRSERNVRRAGFTLAYTKLVVTR